MPHSPRRTVSDWIARAEAATEAAVVWRCLDEATALAGSFHETLRILRAVVARPDAEPARMAALADRLLAEAEVDAEVWGFLDAASTRATRLGDREGALAAFAAAERVFSGAEDTPSYVWMLLAKGRLQSLGDADGARGYAARAAAGGAPDDLCEAAAILVALGDAAGALARVTQAEAKDESFEHAWTIANAYRGLGDPSAGARVLAAALAAATSSEDALRVARASASHEDAGAAARALDRAERLAASADEWLEVAEVAHEIGAAEGVVRRALDEANRHAAQDDEVRVGIAAAYAQRLGDEAAAARVGPRGQTDRDPSTTALFDWLRARVTDDQLRAISRADYGDDAEVHLAALRDVVVAGNVPRRLPWHPGEVVALWRWSAGESVDHLSRALCCTLLCLSARDDGLDGVVAPLVESCLVLGGEAPALAARLLAACAEAGDEDDLPAALGLAILTVEADPDDPRLPPLVARIEAAGDAASRVRAAIHVELWHALAEDVLDPAREGRPAVQALSAIVGR